MEKIRAGKGERKEGIEILTGWSGKVSVENHRCRRGKIVLDGGIVSAQASGGNVGEVSGEELWLVWPGSSEPDGRNKGLGPEGQRLILKGGETWPLMLAGSF